MKDFNVKKLGYDETCAGSTELEIYFYGPADLCSEEFPEDKVVSTSICLIVDIPSSDYNVLSASYAPCFEGDSDTGLWRDFELSEEDAVWLINFARLANFQ